MRAAIMTMRVVHVITGLALGGAEMALYRVLSAMDRRRFEPVVVSLTGDGPVGERIRRLGVPVHRISLRMGVAAPVVLWRFARLLRQLSPDVVQGWQYHGSVAAQLAQMWLGRPIPVLWNIRHCVYDLRDEKRATAAVVRLGARLSRRAAAVIYVSQTAAWQHHVLGYREELRVIVPNGFDTDRFAPSDEARRHLRHELGLSPAAVLVGKLARYHPMKDHANFLAAASELRRAGADVHFVLAGDGVERGNANLMGLVESLGLADHTHLLGQRDDPHRVTAALDIATSASSSEAFPNVIGEAMACGVPCVATDVGDSALIIGPAGRVVPPKQPQALAQAWKNLIDGGREARVALGLTARRRIIEHYALSAVAERYEHLYDELVRPSLAETAPLHLQETPSCVESREN
jgi:glycosyltransferase involved in cell wall biosynthesis